MARSYSKTGRSYIVMALYTHGPLQLWPAAMASKTGRSKAPFDIFGPGKLAAGPQFATQVQYC